jgi:hypothetical protein
MPASVSTNENSCQDPSGPTEIALIYNLGTKLISRASTLALRLVLSPAS